MLNSNNTILLYLTHLNSRIENTTPPVFSCMHTAGYNAYVQIIGGNIHAGASPAGIKVQAINDDTAFIHVLSGQLKAGMYYFYKFIKGSYLIPVDTPDEEEGNDWLYFVMLDIINRHNALIERLHAISRFQDSLELECVLPFEIPLTEFASCHSIIQK